MSGLFVTFEGIDGSGKSLMLKLAAQKLRGLGFDVLCIMEPGGSPLGQKLRSIILDSPYGSVDPRSEALLYAADRALHVANVILPALDAGRVVLCDRYDDSSYAYQGGGRNVELADIRKLNDFATYGLRPDATFLLDLPAETALSRLHGPKDRIEQEDVSFFEDIAGAYRRLAAAEPERFYVIDATSDIKEESAKINEILLRLLKASRS